MREMLKTVNFCGSMSVGGLLDVLSLIPSKNKEKANKRMDPQCDFYNNLGDLILPTPCAIND